MQQRQVRIEGDRGTPAQAQPDRGLEHEQLLGGVGEVVLAANHVGDVRVEVVYRDREVVQDRVIRTGDDGVVEVHVLEAGFTADDVVHDRRPLGGDAPGHRTAL